MHSIPSVAVHPNGKWLCGQSLDNQIVTYSALDKFRINRKKVFKGHTNSGYACQVRAKGGLHGNPGGCAARASSGGDVSVEEVQGITTGFYWLCTVHWYRLRGPWTVDRCLSHHACTMRQRFSCLKAIQLRILSPKPYSCR
jgi:hypothetical protein